MPNDRGCFTSLPKISGACSRTQHRMTCAEPGNHAAKNYVAARSGRFVSAPLWGQVYACSEGASMDTTKRLVLTGGELRDHPGYWKIDGRIEGESEQWSVVRKPDGTYWEVAGFHIFPPNSAALTRIDIGDQILDPKTIDQ